MNHKEQVFLNSCELVLEQFSTKHKGFVYFVWKKGKKHIQSLKYQCSDQLTPMKQTLSLSLKTYAINGILQKRYTHFSLFDGQGRELQHIKLEVTQWKNQPIERRLTLGTCNLRIKVKRKVALELQNFHRHSKTQIEQSSQQQDQEVSHVARMQKRQELSIKEELAKAKREIQDFDYITNKLKNDRNFYIAENQTMRNKLADIHDEYAEQIMKLKNHYDTRIEIRQSIYEQQIQQLITTFNSNYETNRALIEGLVEEKYDYQLQIENIKADHNHYAQQQQINFQTKIEQLQKLIKDIENQKEDHLTKISEKDNHITQLEKLIIQFKQQLKEIKAELDDQINEHRKDNEKWEKQFEQKEILVYKKDEEIGAMKIILDDKDCLITSNNERITSLLTDIEDLNKRNLEKDQMHLQLEGEKNKLFLEIDQVNLKNLALKNDIEILEHTFEQKKQQDKVRYDELSDRYNGLEQRTHQRQIVLTQQIKDEHAKNMQVTQQNFNLNLKIQQLQHQIQLLNEEILMHKNEIENNHAAFKAIQQEMKRQTETFAAQYRDTNQQIRELSIENQALLNQIAVMKEEIIETQKKAELDVMGLRQQYEINLESKIRMYEDQLDCYKQQRQADSQNLANMRRDYQQQLSILFEKETQEHVEVQKFLQQQLDMKNKAYLQLSEECGLIRQTCQDLKLRTQIAQQNRDELLLQLQGGRRNFARHEDDLQIEQIEEQSEEQDDSESEEESDSSEENRKKKKKNKDKDKKKSKKENDKKKKKGKEMKNKKKKKKQTSSESESEPSEPSQQSESEQEGSQILANFSEEDTFDRHIKNLASVDDKKGGSQKMIPFSPDNQIQPVYNTKQPHNTVISIPVPQFVHEEPQPEPKRHKQQRDARDRRDRDDSRDKKDKGQSRQHKDHKKDRSVSSKKKKNHRSSEQEKEDPSENSKVLKGKQRIKQLEKQIKQLKKELKEYERNETQHLAQIEEQQEEIKNLNSQMDNLLKKISKKDPKLARKISSQMQEKRQEKSISNKSIGETSMRVPPMPRKQVEKMRTQNDYLKRAAEDKNKTIGSLQNEKNALILRLQTAQTARAELQKKLGLQPGTVGSQIEQGLKRSVVQLQSKYMGEKERAQEIKLQLNKLSFEKEQLQNENKKLRIKFEDQEEFLKKNQPTQTQKQMQRELEQYSRQFLEMSKTTNSAKLQKQAAEQELRLMKKRYSDIIRASQQAETKAANLQRQAQDLRRKDNKNRRDIEDYLEQIRKYKQQIKALQNDMNSLNTVQSQSLYERKKVMDEIMKLEDALSNKEFEVVKLTKEIDKLKHKLQEGDDIKFNKRNELLQQKQRLDGLLIKAQKRIQQLQEQDRVLKHRISLMQHDSKKGLQERKQTYGQKLRFYVQEISNIKQIVQEYQNENSRLKIQNSQLYQHNQILKISFQKLEIKYQQLVENEQRLLQQLDLMQKEIDSLTQQINQLKLQIQASSITISNLRKQLDTERTVSKKKSDKLTAYEELNEKYLYEIKTLKIKLSEFQTNLNQNELLTEKHQKNTKTIQQLQYQLKALQQEYEHVVNTYTYKREDVEQAMKELKQHEQKIKEQQITRVIEQLDSTHSQKQASMEQEIIELFNENSKLRLSLQLNSDQSTQLKLKIAQLEQLPQKNHHLQKQKDYLEKSLYQLNEQLKAISEDLRRTESKLNQSIRNQEGKLTENLILSKKSEDLERKYKDTIESLNQLKKQEKRLNDRLKQTQDQKTKTVEKLTNDVQHYQNKILSLELQVSRLKETESTSSKEYVKKIKKLQEKIQQMGDTFKQHQETMESHYVSEIKKLEESIQRLSDELEHKMQRIEQVNEALIMLQQENEDLVAELTSARSQMGEENEHYTNEVNHLRNQLRQAQNMYDANIKHLEQEMSSLSRQLTILRYNRQQTGSRLGGSAVQDSSTSAKRLQEKVRLRDKRIEELKSQILTMEESLTKLIKKQSTTENLSQTQIDKLTLSISNYQTEIHQLKNNYQTQTNTLNQSIKTLRRELMQWKNKNQEKQLSLEQKQLQIDSIRVQLKTTKDLYLELQQELQKRKTHLNNQIEEDSHLQAQIRLKNLKINELTDKLEQTTNEKLKLQTQLKRKTLEIKRLHEKTNQLEINFREVHSNQEKKNLEIRTAKQHQRQSEDKLQKMTVENKKLKNEMTLWQTQNHQLKQQLQYNTNSLLQAQHRLQTLKATHTQSQQFAIKYQQLDQLVQNDYQMTLQQFIQKSYWDEQLNSKDRDIQVLADELEELRFLYDHKLLQLDQIKKAKYELQLKTEDNDFIYRQLNQLRVLCSTLDEQKKNALFRQQAIKLQLQTLIESQDRNNITQKLQTILNSYSDN